MDIFFEERDAAVSYPQTSAECSFNDESIDNHPKIESRILTKPTDNTFHAERQRLSPVLRPEFASYHPDFGVLAACCRFAGGRNLLRAVGRALASRINLPNRMQVASLGQSGSNAEKRLTSLQTCRRFLTR